MTLTAEKLLEAFGSIDNNAEKIGEHVECIELIDIDRNLL